MSGVKYGKLKQHFEIPMFILGILFIPVFIGPYFSEMSSDAKVTLRVLGWIIWFAFAVEFALLLYFAPSRKEMLKTHKLDLAIVAVPFFRPLRLLRIFYAITGATGVAVLLTVLRKMLTRPGLKIFFGSVVAILLSGAGLVLAFEHEQPGSTINNVWDALWWTVVTCAAVGYGDQFPVTAGGKIVAVVLILVGLSALSAITASIASYFVEESQDDADAQEKDELAGIKAQLDRIEARLREMTSPQ